MDQVLLDDGSRLNTLKYLSINNDDIIEGKANPINADTLNGQLPEYYAKTSDLDNYAKVEDLGLKMDLLWENASPSSEFAAQTVSLDLEDYQYIYLQCYLHNENDDKPLVTTLLSFSDSAFWIASPGYVTRVRRLSVTKTGITFEVGQKYATYAAAATTANGAIIPYRIYGIK